MLLLQFVDCRLSIAVDGDGGSSAVARVCLGLQHRRYSCDARHLVCGLSMGLRLSCIIFVDCGGTGSSAVSGPFRCNDEVMYIVLSWVC